jgi:chemotaxis protein methyltransferase CheR
MDAAGFLAAVADPARRPALLGRLVDEVAVQETFFLRGPRELEAIDWHRHLAAAHARGEPVIRVWVAACASGEDPYSVAMLAAEAFGQAPAPVLILATDISARALQRASEALYSERSMREVGAPRRARFFTEGGRWSSPAERLRSMVRFCRHNLLEGAGPLADEAPFDLILCRNVLIYFSAETVEAVVASLESALRPGGQLILGASDRLSSSARRLEDIVANPPAPRPAFRKPLGRTARADAPVAAPRPEEASVKQALEAANAGEYAAAVEATERILADDPLDAEAYFVRGLAELAGGDPAAAAASHRRALYIDPAFGLAAFQLGRAQDLRGDARAAARAYRQALRTLEEDDGRHRDLLAGVDAGDIVAACRGRLGQIDQVGLNE